MAFSSIEFIRKSRVAWAGGIVTVAAGILAACVSLADLAGPAEPRSFLWTASKAGQVHYLFGTMHAGVDAERDLGKDVWSAFGASDCLVLEADLEKGSPAELVAMGQLPAGESLQDKVGPATWGRLKSRLAAVPTPTLERTAPWLAMLLYLQTVLPPGEGMDGVFQRRARASGKRLVFLESWQEALAALARVTDERDLSELVDDEASLKSDTARLIAAYKSGDEQALTRVADEIAAASPEPETKLAVLLTGRNRLWQPRLVAALEQQGQCFVAVGAAHLAGKDSLRDLLRADGFTIERR